jgi:predicted dithiol-disulfide oxidoreductase (DUF899 family)
MYLRTSNRHDEGHQKKERRAMTTHMTGTRTEWLAARLELLEAEKELTRRSDELARRRQALPWVRIDKEYRFDTDEGSASLRDLFRGRSQLLVYHFMFGPDYAAGCPSCSAISDGFNGFVAHLANHDVALSAVSRAPLAKLQAYKKRMGWSFPWYSSASSDFNFDYHVSYTPDEVKAGKAEYNYQVSPIGGSEHPGVSVFLKDGDTIYHTYSAYTRGLDMLNVAYHYIDLTPKGRDEGPGGLGEWVRRHDEYPD